MPTIFSKKPLSPDSTPSPSLYEQTDNLVTKHAPPPPPSRENDTPLTTHPTPEHKVHSLSSHHSSRLSTLHESRPVGFFSSYCAYPEKVSFSAQNANEVVLLFLRKHWLTNLPWLLTGIIGMFLPLGFPFVFSFFPSFAPSLLFILTLMYYLFLIGFLLAEFITWFYNVGIVTNIQIVDIDFFALSAKTVSAAELTNIEEVHASQKGVFQSLFNFGDVSMRTKSEMSSIEFSLIPRPVKVNDLILDLIS